MTETYKKTAKDLLLDLYSSQPDDNSISPETKQHLIEAICTSIREYLSEEMQTMESGLSENFYLYRSDIVEGVENLLEQNEIHIDNVAERVGQILDYLESKSPEYKVLKDTFIDELKRQLPQTQASIEIKPGFDIWLTPIG